VLEPGRGQADGIQVRDARETRRGANDLLKLGGGELRVLDAFWRFAQPQLDESGPKLAQIAAPRAFLRELAHGRDRDRFAHERAVGNRSPFVVEGEPALFVALPKRAEVDPCAPTGLCGNDGLELLPFGGVPRRGLGCRRDLLVEAHSGNNSLVTESLSERNRAARELFAPLGPTYDRYARLLSFGQDPRWRSFLVSTVDAKPEDTVLDVACGTAAVSIELAQRYGCRVIGVDQSAEMLTAGGARVEAAGLADRIELRESRAEELLFEDGSFGALTFTYLLRYVDDPAATMHELARVVRPGGRVAMLDFFVPAGLARPAWELYVRVGLPVLGRAISAGWGEVGSFLGPSIRGFWERHPVEELVASWRDAGIVDVRGRRLSLGGGLVLWGTRGD
jgi:demethylmenaquinone methyltransferase/2-methoxy-6-polyprenyl-1,4-benzoquinol methylase